MKGALTLTFGLAFGILFFACGTGSPSGETAVVGPDTSVPCTFTNPIADGADPWVVRRDGWYYLVEFKEGGISVYRSKELTDLKKNESRVRSATNE